MTTVEKYFVVANARKMIDQLHNLSESDGDLANRIKQDIVNSNDFDLFNAQIDLENEISEGQTQEKENTNE